MSIVIYGEDSGICRTKDNIDTMIIAFSKDSKMNYLGKINHLVGVTLLEIKIKTIFNFISQSL
jgi:hypothetical protein